MIARRVMPVVSEPANIWRVIRIDIARCVSPTHVDRQPPNDLVVVHPVRVFLLFDESIEEIHVRCGEVLVSAVDAGHGALNAHSNNRFKGPRANGVYRIFV